jgi:hypothetical protein
MAYQIPDVSRIDINKLGPKGGSEPDFIPNPTPADKDFYRQAVFNTGSVWLLGMLFGGAYGGFDGYRHAPGRSLRILSNSILNGISKRGSSLGNRVAVVGLNSLYSISPLHSPASLCLFLSPAMLHTLSTASGSMFFDDFLPDLLPHSPSEFTVPIFSGILTGTIFTAGFGHRNPRIFLMAATIGAVVSCGYTFGGSYAYNALLGTRARRKF